MENNRSEFMKSASRFSEDFFDKVGIEENGQLVLKAGKTAKAEGITEKDVDPEQLAKGIKVEMEHTNDKAEAKKIALDHLAELPDYYTRLAKMEGKSVMRLVLSLRKSKHVWVKPGAKRKGYYRMDPREKHAREGKEDKGEKPKGEGEKVQDKQSLDPKDWKHAGFDLTEMKPGGWQKVLSSLGLPEEGVRIPYKDEDDPNGKFVWGRNDLGIRIVTANNPITGEYHNKGGRENEKDYASYIGISGEPDKVKQAFALIKKHSKFRKEDDPNERQFI